MALERMSYKNGAVQKQRIVKHTAWIIFRHTIIRNVYDTALSKILPF